MPAIHLRRGATTMATTTPFQASTGSPQESAINCRKRTRAEQSLLANADSKGNRSPIFCREFEARRDALIEWLAPRWRPHRSTKSCRNWGAKRSPRRPAAPVGGLQIADAGGTPLVPQPARLHGRDQARSWEPTISHRSWPARSRQSRNRSSIGASPWLSDELLAQGATRFMAIPSRFCRGLRSLPGHLPLRFLRPWSFKSRANAGYAKVVADIEQPG